MTAMESAVQQTGESAGLSQVERIVDTFVAPTKTFTDIRRNASWWLPFLLGILVSFAFVSSIDHKIGFDQVAQSNINRNAQAQQNMSNLPDAQRDQTIHRIAGFTKVVSYLYPVLGLIFALISAGILMLTFNFGLGAKRQLQRIPGGLVLCGTALSHQVPTGGDCHFCRSQRGTIRHQQSRWNQRGLVSHLG